MAQDGRSGSRPTRGTLAYGLPVVPILPVVAAAFSSLMARPAPRPDRCTETTGQDDPKGMGWFTTDNEKPMTLTTEERKLFDRLDQAVVLGTKAAKVVIEAGRALGTIRDRQLYRDVVSTWEEYLERHGLTRRRADQMVAAAATLDAVAEAVQSKTGTVVPSFDQMTERTARNLVGMNVEDAAEAVIEAAGTTEGLTPKTIKAAASKRKKAKAAKVPRPRRFKVAGATVVIMFNRKSNGSTLDALAAATAMAEADLELQARQSEAA